MTNLASCYILVLKVMHAGEVQESVLAQTTTCQDSRI
jgi:hypothetical protein